MSFSFGAAAAPPAQQQPGFSFGTAQPTTTNATAASTTGGFGFGQQQQQQPPPQPPVFGFGGQPQPQPYIRQPPVPFGLGPSTTTTVAPTVSTNSFSSPPSDLPQNFNLFASSSAYNELRESDYETLLKLLSPNHASDHPALVFLHETPRRNFTIKFREQIRNILVMNGTEYSQYRQLFELFLQLFCHESNGLKLILHEKVDLSKGDGVENTFLGLILKSLNRHCWFRQKMGNTAPPPNTAKRITSETTSTTAPANAFGFNAVTTNPTSNIGTVTFGSSHVIASPLWSDAGGEMIALGQIVLGIQQNLSKYGFHPIASASSSSNGSSVSSPTIIDLFPSAVSTGPMIATVPQITPRLSIDQPLLVGTYYGQLSYGSEDKLATSQQQFEFTVAVPLEDGVNQYVGGIVHSGGGRAQFIGWSNIQTGLFHLKSTKVLTSPIEAPCHYYGEVTRNSSSNQWSFSGKWSSARNPSYHGQFELMLDETKLRPSEPAVQLELDEMRRWSDIPPPVDLSNASKFTDFHTQLAAIRAIRSSTEATEISGCTAVHNGVTCDGCRQRPLLGARWKCDICPNWDYCTACRTTNNEMRTHKKSHTFTRWSSASLAGGNPMATIYQPGQAIDPIQPKSTDVISRQNPFMNNLLVLCILEFGRHPLASLIQPMIDLFQILNLEQKVANRSVTSSASALSLTAIPSTITGSDETANSMELEFAFLRLFQQNPNMTNELFPFIRLFRQAGIVPKHITKRLSQLRTDSLMTASDADDRSINMWVYMSQWLTLEKVEFLLRWLLEEPNLGDLYDPNYRLDWGDGRGQRTILSYVTRLKNARPHHTPLQIYSQILEHLSGPSSTSTVKSTTEPSMTSFDVDQEMVDNPDLLGPSSSCSSSFSLSISSSSRGSGEGDLADLSTKASSCHTWLELTLQQVQSPNQFISARLLERLTQPFLTTPNPPAVFGIKSLATTALTPHQKASLHESVSELIRVLREYPQELNLLEEDAYGNILFHSILALPTYELIRLKSVEKQFFQKLDDLPPTIMSDFRRRLNLTLLSELSSETLLFDSTISMKPTPQVGDGLLVGNKIFPIFHPNTLRLEVTGIQFYQVGGALSPTLQLWDVKTRQVLAEIEPNQSTIKSDAFNVALFRSPIILTAEQHSLGVIGTMYKNVNAVYPKASFKEISSQLNPHPDYRLDEQVHYQNCGSRENYALSFPQTTFKGDIYWVAPIIRKVALVVPQSQPMTRVSFQFTSPVPFVGFGMPSSAGGFGSHPTEQFQDLRGTRYHPFQPKCENSKDWNGRTITSLYQSITCLPEYESQSFEELRCEDDSLGGFQTYQGQTTTTATGFGEQPPTPSPFGQQRTIGQPQVSAFGGGGAPTTPTGGFGFGTSTIPSSSTSGLFGATPSTPAFSSSTGSSSFGTNQTGGFIFGSSSQPANSSGFSFSGPTVSATTSSNSSTLTPSAAVVTTPITSGPNEPTNSFNPIAESNENSQSTDKSTAAGSSSASVQTLTLESPKDKLAFVAKDTPVVYAPITPSLLYGRATPTIQIGSEGQMVTVTGNGSQAPLDFLFSRHPPYPIGEFIYQLFDRLLSKALLLVDAQNPSVVELIQSNSIGNIRSYYTNLITPTTDVSELHAWLNLFQSHSIHLDPSPSVLDVFTSWIQSGDLSRIQQWFMNHSTDALWPTRIALYNESLLDTAKRLENSPSIQNRTTFGEVHKYLQLQHDRWYDLFVPLIRMNVTEELIPDLTKIVMDYLIPDLSVTSVSGLFGSPTLSAAASPSHVRGPFGSPPSKKTYCGRSYCFRRTCKCGGCDGRCGPDAGCQCPTCEAIDAITGAQ